MQENLQKENESRKKNLKKEFPEDIFLMPICKKILANRTLRVRLSKIVFEFIYTSSFFKFKVSLFKRHHVPFV